MLCIRCKNANNAARDVAFVKDRHPEVTQKLSDFRFPGQGQRKTTVTCAQGMVELVLLLPGRHAARVRPPGRREAASVTGAAKRRPLIRALRARQPTKTRLEKHGQTKAARITCCLTGFVGAKLPPSCDAMVLEKADALGMPSASPGRENWSWKRPRPHGIYCSDGRGG